jgi:hypothetical protein
LFIDRATGNVGIGTAGPSGILEVSHDGSTHDLFVDGATGNVGIGTLGPNGQLAIYTNTWEETSHAQVSIHGVNNEVETPAFEISDENSNVYMKVSSTGTGTPNTDADQGKVYIAGKVGIGISSPSYELEVDGDIQCVQLHETSDVRLKTNISQLTNALEKVARIRGGSFEWNDVAESVGASPGEKQIGVVAQELEKEFPELVSAPEGQFKSVDYGKLTAVLIEAVKELKAENEALKDRIEALETER